jgi:hypothetical protein
MPPQQHKPRWQGAVQHGTAQQGAGGLVQEVQLRGAKRTQELIRQNQHLPQADKVALAEQERIKGNEHFRWVGLQ